MKTFNVLYVGVALSALAGCGQYESVVQQVPDGVVLENNEGKLLKPGEYYFLTDNPVTVWKDQWVQVTVPVIAASDQESNQEYTAVSVIFVYLPPEQMTEEITRRIKQTPLDGAHLAELVQKKVDTEQWVVVERFERRGPAKVLVFDDSAIQKKLSLLEIMPQPHE